jgi:drug/metabolite transporter (DMT)-like permease
MAFTLDASTSQGARARIVAAAVLFSTGGLAIKSVSLTAWQVACFRAAAAALAIALLAPAARRAWSWRTTIVAMPFAATIILYTLANRTTTAANAIFLQDTAPLYVLLLGPWLLGERVTKRNLGFAAAIGVGLVLLFAGTGAPMATAPDPVRGNILATAAGLTWALTIMGLRWLASGPGGNSEAMLSGALAGNALAAVIAGLFAFPVAQFTALDGLLVVYLGVFQIACAYLLISSAMTRLNAFEVSLLLLVEPVLTPVWAWLVLGEPTGVLVILGGALIVSATALHSSWGEASRR